MKKIFILACTVITISQAYIVPTVFADDAPVKVGVEPATPVKIGVVPASPTTGTLQNPLQAKSLGDVINLFIDLITYIAVIAGVLALIWVGFEFILARGNSSKAKEAKDKLVWIVVGLALVISARLIILVVLSTLKATNTVSPGVIDSSYNALNQH